MADQIDWDDLRHVLALARGGTLSRAAERLGVTHTTVGRRLRAVEERLGVRLFDRTPEGFVATPAGQDLAEVAERTEAEVLALEGRILGRDVRLHGALRVATMDLLFRRAHAAFGRFMARYPSVELTVTSSDDEVSLTRRAADVAMRLTGTPPPHLIGRRVGQLRFAVYGTAALVDRIGADAGYGAFPWIHWDTRLNMRWLDDWLARNAPGARIALRVDITSVALHHVIASGLGVHFLACCDGDADPGLRRIGPVQADYSRDVWLLTLPELQKTPRIRAFMDHMADDLQTHGIFRPT